MTFINSLVTWIMKKRMHQIELFIKYPNEVQDEWFKNLIDSAENTEWGKKYGYKSIVNVDDFRQRFPIQTYDT
ncbi:MAG: GH3 family domain-containing protein, partial [Janthinobacterium lividum]